MTRTTLLVAAALCGCSNQFAEHDASPGLVHDAGTDAGPTQLGWSKGPALLQSRDHHTSVAIEGTEAGALYVLGGWVDHATVLTSTEVARIRADGSLEPWEAGEDLPAQMFGHVVALAGRTVLVGAGTGATGFSDATHFAIAGDDGTLGGWQGGPTLAEGRFHAAAIGVGDAIYVVGGLIGDGTDSTPTIERSVVAADGTPGAFERVRDLPGRRSHHAVAAYGGWLFVVAGLFGDPNATYTALREVIRAHIEEDGALGEWETVGELPEHPRSCTGARCTSWAASREPPARPCPARTCGAPRSRKTPEASAPGRRSRRCPTSAPTPTRPRRLAPPCT